MHAVAVVGGSRVVGGRPDEWVRELDAPTDLDEPGINRRVGCGHLDTEGLGGTVEQHGIFERLRCCCQDEQLRLGRQQAEAPA